jgi:DNA-binding transcriptional ArsR family regulator
MRPFIDIAGALADEHRARALLALRKGELCLCQITELLGLAPSTVSKHLSVLKGAGLVEARKQGRWMYFRITQEQHAPPAVIDAIHWTSLALCREPRILDDARRLRQILCEDPEELCRRQCARRNCCPVPGSTRPARPGRANSSPSRRRARAH